jgi:hypothetical protein
MVVAVWASKSEVEFRWMRAFIHFRGKGGSFGGGVG